jgi:hypothetical protein
MFWDVHPGSRGLESIVADPGSGAFLIPGSGMGFFSGSRIPDPKYYVRELGDNFLGKKFNNSSKIGPNFFFCISKIK